MGEKNNINVKIENHGVIPKEEEHATPEELYSRLIDKIKRYHPSAGDLSAIDKAYNFAKKSHGDQKRKSGEPYIIHPLCVAIILAELELDKETIIKQISKTTDTPYYFKNINIDLDKNLFLPKISILNELRRTALSNVENFAISKIHRQLPKSFVDYISKETDSTTLNNMRNFNNTKINSNATPKVSLLLNVLHSDWNYNKLENIDSIYIPLKYFTSKKYSPVLKIISKKFDTYIYMPTIIKSNYENLFLANAEEAVEKYNIQGFVISNIGNLNLLHSLFNNLDEYYKVIANYTFNVYNSETVLELKKLGISSFTLSPELDKQTITSLCNYNYLQKELIVYGKVPLLNINYCLLR